MIYMLIYNITTYNITAYNMGGGLIREGAYFIFSLKGGRMREGAYLRGGG